MKSARPLLIALGGVIVVLGLAIALALQPSVQGWALRRLVARSLPGLQFDFERFAAGPARIQLQGVRFARRGLAVEADRVAVGYSLWRYLTEGTLHLAQLEADGLVVDLARLTTGEAGAGAAGAPVAAPGAVVRLQLPFALVVDRVDLRGRMRLPGGETGRVLPAEFTLAGGGIAPEQEGALRFQIKLTDPAPQARVAALRAHGQLVLRQTAARGFDRVHLTAVVDPDGPGLSEHNRLQFAASLDTAAGAADYALTLDTLRDGATENLVRIRARQAAAGAAYSGDWSLQARTVQVEPFFMGGALPRFTVQGSGRFELQPATGSAAVSGAWKGDVAALEAIDPVLRPLGALRFEAEFDVANAAGVTRVETFRLQLDGTQPVLTAVMRRAVTVDWRARQLQIGGPSTGEVGRLTLHRLPLAWVRPLIKEVDVSGGALSGDFVLTNGEGELRVHSAAPLRIDTVTLVRDGRLLVERAGFSTLLQLALLPGGARVELRDIDFRTAAGDRVLGGLAVQAPLAGPGDTLVRGNVDADLPALLGPSAGVGHVKFSGEIDAAINEPRIVVRSFRAGLADGAGHKLFDASGAEPFTLDLEHGQLVSRGPDEVVLARVGTGRVAFAELPLPAWRGRLRGVAEPSDFTLVAQGPRVHLRAGAPVRVTGFGVRDGARALLDGVTFEVTPSAEFAGVVDWQVSAAGLQARDASGAALAGFGFEASVSPADGLRAAANFNADLAVFGTQPGFAPLRALSAGRASGELRAARTAAGWQAEARATLNGLVAREGSQPLPVANLSARAIRGADGRFTLEMPLLLDRSGRRSDLRFAAEAVRRDGGIGFDATLSGQHVDLLDVVGLTALLPGGAGGAAQAAGEPVADAQPFWQGWQGAVALDIQSLTSGDDWKVAGLTGRATVAADRVVLEKFEGAINERGRVAADAQLVFGGGGRPYALAGAFTLSEFDLGALLKGFESDRLATVDGVFAVSGKFTGDGGTLGQTLGRTRGRFQLTGRQGHFRGLRRTTEKVSVATRAVELGAAIGSIFGSSKVKEAAEKVAGQAYQVDQAAQLFAELPYDQLVVRLSRAENLNLLVEEFALLSPEVRLTGRGTIAHVEGKPIPQQPLNLTLQLAGRGRIEQQLGRLRVLDGTKDELGYAKMRDTFPLGGTLLRPDPTPFFLKLVESKAGDLLGSGN